MTRVETDRLVLFFGVLIVLVSGIVSFSQATGVGMLALIPVYMMTPMVAGLAVSVSHGISVSDLGLRIGRKRWLLGASVLYFPLLALIVAVSVSVPGITFDPTAPLEPSADLTAGLVPVLSFLGLALLTGVTVSAVFGFGEEFGWRGYLLWELAPLGFWKASLVIGTIWGVWHTPMLLAGHNYPSDPLTGVIMMTGACIAMAPLYTFIVVRSGSVLPAALFHGVVNTVALVPAYAVTDNPFLRDFVASPVGLAGITVFGLFAIGILLAGTPHLTRSFSVPTEPSTGDEHLAKETAPS